MYFIYAYIHKYLVGERFKKLSAHDCFAWLYGRAMASAEPFPRSYMVGSPGIVTVMGGPTQGPLGSVSASPQCPLCLGSKLGCVNRMIAKGSV